MSQPRIRITNVGGSGSGQKGDPGDSAYQVAINNGFAGTEQEWLDSLIGDQGPAGADGINGNNGEDGLDSLFLGTWNSVTEFLAIYQGGPVGLADGDWWAFVKDNENPNKIYVVREDPNSATGWVIDDNEHFVLPQGPAGSDGADGANGTDGINGTDGADGADGSPGLVYLGNYISGNGYIANVAVVKGSDNNLYIATSSGGLGDPVGNSAEWNIFLPKGVDGANGADGEDGADGADGATGPKGDQGDPGPAGADGLDGQDGADGAPGAKGDKGDQGEPGLDGDRYETTSTNTLTINQNGQITISVEPGLAYSPAQTIIIAHNEANHMHGTIYSYNETTGQLVVDLNSKTGSGTYSTWTVNLDGAAGSPGPAGTAATISVGTTTTGNAGTSASVTNSGTSSAAVFNFTIPRGDKGNTGEKGDKGDTGSPGAGGAIGYYGSFYDTQTQQLTSQEVAALTSKPVLLRATDTSNGVSIVDNSKITFEHAGIYDLQFSFQFHNEGGAGNGTTVEIWLRKNGTDVPETNTRVAVIPNSPYVVSAWDFMFEVADNDYFQVMWVTDNSSIYLKSNTGALGGPHIPSAIVTVMPVMYTQVGPTGATGATGPGVAAGGTSGQYLTKVNGTDYNTQWSTLDLSGKQNVVTGVSDTEIGYLDGVTSLIQTQLDNKVSAVTPLTLTQASNSASYPLTISSANQQNGGTGYADILKITNTVAGTTNPNKFIRMNNAGSFEIVNNAYSSVLLYLEDNGNLSISGSLGVGSYTAGQHIKTTIWSASDIGFTATYSQATNSYTTIASKTYTPASASSYIFVEVYARYGITGAAEDSFLSQLTWAENEFAVQRQYWANGSGGGTRSSTLFPLAGRITNNSLTGYTLAINARRDSSDDVLSVFADNAFYVKITEIAR